MATEFKLILRSDFFLQKTNGYGIPNKWLKCHICSKMSIVIKIIKNMSRSEWLFILTKNNIWSTLHWIRYGAQWDESFLLCGGGIN